MQPTVYPRAEHGISRKGIDSDALAVLQRLERSGYQAYLVGGGVRDLLLGLQPKDFDVVTDAHPMEIKRVFRNCRIIGRRFRLAHVFFGPKIIEVSTFRRKAEPSVAEGAASASHENTFGSAEEDAWRRDFTINALFYNIADFSILDYVGGVADLRARRIVSIGDPLERFPEDPVRMIRALRLAARLEFEIDAAVLAAIERHGAELARAAPARLFEELSKTLLCRASAPALQLLSRHRLLDRLLPELAHLVRELDPAAASRNGTTLRALDEYPARERISAAVWLAALLVVPVERALQAAAEESPAEQLLRFLDHAVAGLPIPRRVRDRLQQIFLAQGRLARPPRDPAAPIHLLNKPYFDEALTLFEIRAAATGVGLEQLEQWHRWRELHPARPEPRARRRPRRRRRKP
ncbi:MAG TPA: polynucleotide adenylyltransferase PcnB [Acidobacteriota bacterium]